MYTLAYKRSVLCTRLLDLNLAHQLPFLFHRPASCDDCNRNAHAQGVPDKGKVLTKISLFWFEKLQHVIPTHLVTADVDAMPAEVRKYKAVLDGRAMLVRKAKVVPLEAIVRGYITGTSPSPILNLSSLSCAMDR